MARMYKTGDLARYLPDGNIEFLGRNDSQVKVSWLSHRAGRDRDAAGPLPRCARSRGQRPRRYARRQRLCAYLVTQDGVELPLEKLRAHLLATLPEYMIPVAYVRLDAFPLTLAGKLIARRCRCRKITRISSALTKRRR